MKRGDIVLITTGHKNRQLEPRQIVSIGKAWITVEGGAKYAAEPSIDGSHYGSYGSRLWPSREAYEQSAWLRTMRPRIADRIQRGNYTVNELREVARLLKIEED